MRNFMISMVVATAGLGACGGGSASPKEQCQDFAKVFCNRVYECYTAAEVMTAGFPASEAECVAKQESVQMCATATTTTACEMNETFHPDKADTCVGELEAASCTEVHSGMASAYAPSCDAVCTAN